MRKLIYIAMILLFTVGMAYAGLNDRHSNIDLKRDNPTGTAPANRGWIYTKDDSGGTMRLYFQREGGTINMIGAKRSILLPINDWWTSYSQITARTIPKFERRIVGGSGITPAIIWANGFITDRVIDNDDYKLSPAMIQFNVPDYYQSGGEWALWVQHEIPLGFHTTPHAISWDYEYYIQSEGEAWDDTPTKGTLVKQAGNGFIDKITLSSAGISAGDVVNLRVWPTGKGLPQRHQSMVKKLLDAAFLFE